ncbi:hypothetical protein GOP47_0013646 [Adiantum capillus-veneris]|uniref:DNA-binding protein BIN4 n=1 Tax=Adiantum capillus-veneris TaxID=13818 RepID=A0A9D4ZFJ1_ADICA|nr:hypothetical protein GOP47_0013646 [Adiantum capillus-veneris]
MYNHAWRTLGRKRGKFEPEHRRTSMGNDKNPDREDSPDWLRTFQTPLKDVYTISSSSPSPSASPKARSNSKAQELDEYQSNDFRQQEVEQEAEDVKDESLLKVEPVVLQEEGAGEGQERRIKRVVSTLPLVVGDKIHRSKVLLECEGDDLDVSGDVGAVGRINVSANDNDFLLDLKGILYKATIIPSNTFLVVNVGQSEAKVEAIMNDFVQLQPSGNIFETETMVEGTLEGFGFDSDEDKEYAPVAAGLGTTANLHDEAKKEIKQAKQKAKSNKSLKSLKGSGKKIGKSKTTKLTKKGGGTKKHAKKTSTQKR